MAPNIRRENLIVACEARLRQSPVEREVAREGEVVGERLACGFAEGQ